MFFRAFLVTTFVIALASGTGCGGGGTGALIDSGNSDASGAPDTGREAGAQDAAVLDDGREVELEEAAADVGWDFGKPEDVEPQCQPGQGCFGNQCTDNDQCLSGYCVEHMGDGVCTQLCQEECPAGWACKLVGGSGPDPVSVCVSAFANLCKPCAASADCKSPGGADDPCLDYGSEGSFCGGACSVTNPCPWGFTCKGTETVEGTPKTQCVSDTGSCPCAAKSVAVSLSTPCSVENEYGACKGKRTCTEEGLSACDAPVPDEETCNGLDDDCDGQADEVVEKEGVAVTVCDDGNGCTKDVCLGAGGCSYEPLLSGECMDGDSCTMGDHCEQGSCVGTPIDCDDKNPCTDDECDGQGGCANTFNLADCDDGDPCTVKDTCAEGTCSGYAVACDCAADADCAALEDGNLCNGTLYCEKGSLPWKCEVKGGTTIACPDPEGKNAPCLDAACDPLTGDCMDVPAHEGQGCSDGDACTLYDSCVAGVCSGSGALSCNDGNLCTDDSCDPSSGCVYEANTADCDDANECTTADHCVAGACLPGAGISCDDANACTADACDPKEGCKYGLNSSPCDDGNLCTSGDHCELGACIGGGTVSCNDGNACTDDSCSPKAGCQFVPNILACNDGNACTLGDYCSAGKCTAETSLGCDDGNACTEDSCGPAVGCVHKANMALCNDGNACTLVDTCDQGKCIGADPMACNDGNHCTEDSCDPVSGCAFAPFVGACEDGNACTEGDKCEGGKCAPGTALPCSDGNLCTDDSCDPDSGCAFVPNTVPCSDSDPCTVTDVCGGGQCVGTGTLPCDDGKKCTSDACQPGIGCAYTPIVPCCGNGVPEAGEQCDDGNSVGGDGCENDCKSSSITQTVPGFSGDLGPDLTSMGFSQCGGIAGVGVMGKQFYALCNGAYSKILFACSTNNDKTAEFVSPAFSMVGLNLTDGVCDDWPGASNSIYGSDFILSVDSSNPNCGNYNVSYQMYVHFGTQWGCAGVTNTHNTGGHMWAYVAK